MGDAREFVKKNLERQNQAPRESYDIAITIKPNALEEMTRVGQQGKASIGETQADCQGTTSTLGKEQTQASCDSSSITS
jgi:hypothetical protein